MKSIIRSLGMSAVLAVTLGAGAAYAQDACSDTAAQDAAQAKINGVYKTDVKTALDLGKQYLEKFGKCEYSIDYVKWLSEGDPTKNVPGRIEAWTKIVTGNEAAAKRKQIIDRFDAALSSKNYADAYAAGSEFVSAYPNDPVRIHIMVQMGLIGYYESYPPKSNYKFNEDALRYAREASSAISAGAQGKVLKDNPTPRFGGPLFEDTKENTLSELSYAQAYITYWAKGDKKGALPLYYQTIQMTGRHKDDPYAYASIAGYYADEAGKLGKQYADLVAQRKPDNTPEVAADLETKIKQTEGMLKGYLDRAIDAYSRAYNFTKNDAANKQTRDGLFAALQNLYKIRYQKETGINEFITATVAKPMPNPSTEVTPVIEADTTTTTGGVGAANGSGTGAANGTGIGAANGTGIGNAAAAKPATTTAAKPAATPASKPATTTATTKPAKPRK